MDDRNHDEIVSEQNEKLRIQRNYYRRLHVDDLCILNAEEYYESLKDWSKFKEPRDTSKRDAEKDSKVTFWLKCKSIFFKSLGHNPTILGLFFSILNQFTNTSSFVSEGELITLNNSDGKFELEGHNVPSKLFCGFVNWLGHLVSDVSGASSSTGRGMGIPSPIWSWTNDVIAIKLEIVRTVKSFLPA